MATHSVVTGRDAGHWRDTRCDQVSETGHSAQIKKKHFGDWATAFSLLFVTANVGTHGVSEPGRLASCWWKISVLQVIKEKTCCSSRPPGLLLLLRIQRNEHFIAERDADDAERAATVTSTTFVVPK